MTKVICYLLIGEVSKTRSPGRQISAQPTISYYLAYLLLYKYRKNNPLLMHLLSLERRWLFYLAIVVFIVVKIPYLQCSFYWDESWVYAPAVYLMQAHGASLLPTAIPVDYSRGHPLFFHAAYAVWMDIFGKSHLSMHCFALLISTSLAVAMYEILRKFFNVRVALLGGIFLLLNVNFFVASSYVLTDIMLTLFVFLSLYCYIKEKHFLTVLFLTLLLYTKESGIVLCAVFGLDIALLIIAKKTTTKQAIFKLLSVIVPVACIMLFFVAQKQAYGWYLYPNHTSRINFNIEFTMYILKRIVSTIFFDEHIYIFYALFVAISVIAAYKQKQPKYLFFILSATLIYLNLLVFSDKDLIFYGCIAYLGVFSFFFSIKYQKSFNHLQARFIKLSLLFCILFIYFSCVNFFAERYMFPVLFLFSIILLAVFLDFFISKTLSKQFGFLVVILILAGLTNFRYSSIALGDFHRMAVHHDIVNYFEEHHLYNAHIYSNSFLETVHLKDPQTGYLRSDRYFRNVTDKIDSQTEYVIFNHIDGTWEELDHVYGDTSFHLVFDCDKKGNTAYIYRRKRLLY